MSSGRNDFGAWGAELGAGDFARALAAAGVVNAAATWAAAGDVVGATTALRAVATSSPKWILPWRLSGDEARAFAGGEARGRPSAAALAGAWAALVSGGMSPRLEITSQDVGAVFWTAAQLAREEVSAASVYVRRDEPQVPVAWEWPLRVGLLADPESRAVRTRLTRTDFPGWMPVVTTFVEVGDDAPCDLLLLPFDLERAVAAALSARRPLHADATIVLGGARGSARRQAALVDALRAGVRTSGVALLGADATRGDLEGWFIALVEILSHNRTLDEALHAAGRHHLRRAPILVASRALVEFSSVARQLQALGRRMRARPREAAPVEIPPGGRLESMLGRSGPMPPAELAETLEHAERNIGWSSESGMASVAAEAARAGAVAADGPAAPETSPQAPPARFLQARVTEAGASASAAGVAPEPVTAFRAGRAHDVIVHIGTPEAGAVVAPGPFPVHELPPDQETYELTVVFTEPRLLDEPQTARILLPREGNSTRCTFTLFVAEQVSRVEARVIVAYGNRILQTATLTGPVVRAPEEAPRTGAIVFEMEAVIRAHFEDLGRRRRFDAALVLNPDATGALSVTKLADGHATLIVQDELKTEIAWFDRMLTEVAYHRESYRGLEGRAAREDLLRAFAQHGSLLHDYIVEQGLVGIDLTPQKRIQIISTKLAARIPVELIYDLPAPEPTAPLCGNATEALATGSCAASCPPVAERRTVICPLGFWGLSKVLERHAYDKTLAAQLRGFDYAFQSEPTRGRDALDVLAGALIAGSQRVDKSTGNGLALVEQASRQVSRTPPSLASDWTAWTEVVRTQAPSLLVLLVHTEPVAKEDTQQKMEIGTEKWLYAANVEPRHVRPPSAPKPLVLLLGCETVGPDVPLGLAAKFRLEGAAIVVCTGASIHSEHAVAMARTFLASVREQSGSGDRSFGDVMLAVRRQMLAEGIPTALTLCAVGDADWRLVSGR